MDGRAESEPIEFRILFGILLEITQHRPYQVRDGIIEHLGRQLVARPGRRIGEAGVEGEFQKDLLPEYAIKLGAAYETTWSCESNSFTMVDRSGG
jgi:hypothetical protein